MPSLRIASIGASIASARITCTPCGSCSRGSGIRSPTRGAIRTSASSALARLGLEDREGALQPLVVEGEFGASLPERSEEDDEHLRGALARVGRDLLAAGFEVGGGDAGGGDGVASGAEGRQPAQLGVALADVARGQRLVAVEERVVAVLGVDVEGNLVAAGDERAEPDRRLGGKTGQRVVEQPIVHAPDLPGVAYPSCACTDACRT